MEKTKLNILVLAGVSILNVVLLFSGTASSLSCTIASGVATAYAAVVDVVEK